MKRRPDRKEIRRQEAQERQAACDKLSPEQRLANLDTLFGEGMGATKERRNLQVQIAAREEPAS